MTLTMSYREYMELLDKDSQLISSSQETVAEAARRGFHGK